MYNQNNNNNQARKEYTPLNLKRSVTQDGMSRIAVTVKSAVARPTQPRQVGDQLVMDFSMPISGRSKYIADLCGMHPHENEDGTVWAKVTFWQDANAQNGPVSRLDKLFTETNGKGVALVVVGTITVSENEGKDGKVYVNTNIKGDDFIVTAPTQKQYSNKDYTFINMKRCVGKNGNNYIGVTTEVVLFDAKERTTSTGKRVLEFRSNIRGKDKYIESMCGMAPYKTENGGVLAKIAFWQNADQERGIITRMNRMIEKNPGKNFVLAVTGSIKTSQHTDGQGRTFIDTTITADDFIRIRTFDKKEQQEDGQSQQHSGYGQPQGQQTQGYGQPEGQNQNYGQPEQEHIPSGMNGDFIDIDDDDDELPF